MIKLKYSSVDHWTTTYIQKAQIFPEGLTHFNPKITYIQKCEVEFVMETKLDS